MNYRFSPRQEPTAESEVAFSLRFPSRTTIAAVLVKEILTRIYSERILNSEDEIQRWKDGEHTKHFSELRDGLCVAIRRCTNIMKSRADGEGGVEFCMSSSDSRSVVESLKKFVRLAGYGVEVHSNLYTLEEITSAAAQVTEEIERQSLERDALAAGYMAPGA